MAVSIYIIFARFLFSISPLQRLYVLFFLELFFELLYYNLNGILFAADCVSSRLCYVFGRLLPLANQFKLCMAQCL